MKKLNYLAYGSNLHPTRLQERTPSARPLALVTLAAWDLRFHKRGMDGSGKCNIIRTGRDSDKVQAVVFEILEREKENLDQIEGLGKGYEQSFLTTDKHGEVFFYAAQKSHIDDSLSPFTWYKNLVLAGAYYHKIPNSYIKKIQEVEAMVDPDTSRYQTSLALLEKMAPPQLPANDFLRC